MIQSVRIGVLAFATLCLLPACKPVQAPAAAKPDAAPAPTAAKPAPIPARSEPRIPGPEQMKRDTTPVDSQVVGVVLSKQGDTEGNTIGAAAANFGPHDTVYAQVKTSGTAGSYMLYAKWVAVDGTPLSDYGVKLSKPGEIDTVISLSKPDGWQQGANKIELAINGKDQRTVTFNVR